MTDLADPPPHRALYPDVRGRGGLRVSWHTDPGVVVFSLWRDDVCVGTSRLPAGRTRDLAAFLTAHLASDRDLAGGER